MSQELLLRIQRDRELDAGCSPDGQLPSCGNSPRTTPAIVPANAFPAAVAAAEAPGLSSSTAAAAPATNDADAHVHELTLQASRLRDMSRSVKGLLQLATGEVEGALEATGNTEIHSSSRFHGAVPPPVETDRDVRVVTTTTQTEGVLVGREVVDGLKEELRVADGATKAIQREKARLDEELHRTAVQLAEIREALSNKTAQVCFCCNAVMYLVFSLFVTDSYVPWQSVCGVVAAMAGDHAIPRCFKFIQFSLVD